MYKIIKYYGSCQGEEFFDLEHDDGKIETLNIWDYASLYKYPNLYQQLICGLLECDVYSELWKPLSEVTCIKRWRVLDIACGSGLMGKYIKNNSLTKVELLVGIDILPEAIIALNRDNPNVYDKTYILGKDNIANLKMYEFNCLIVSAAANHLALNDYQNYVKLLSANTYIVFNLTKNPTGQKRLKILQWMDNNFKLCYKKLYPHRKLMNGRTIEHEVFMYIM